MSELSPALYRAGEGEPVVLLHGATGTWRHWRPVLADLVARFEVIAPTLAGHDGGPPFPRGVSITIGGAADSLERHLDDLSVGSAHLVGNSLGGALAIELAKRGRALSAIAISPACGWEAGSPEARRVARFFARTVRRARIALPRVQALMRRPRARHIGFRDIMRHGELVAPDDAADLVRATARFALIDELVRALGRDEDVLLQDLDRVAVPVLLAWAEHDRILPEQTCSTRFRREIPGADYRVLPGVGHVPMWDDRQLVVDTVVDWIAGQARARVPVT